MATDTDLANRALARIGQTKISNIEDTNSKAALACKEFLSSTIDEVLRSHRWNCASKRQTLTLDVTPPAFGYTNSFVLPSDYLRLMEVNGEQVTGSEEFYEIEGRRIVMDAGVCQIRYISRIPVSSFDALLFEAVAAKLAFEIALTLTGKVELQTQSMKLYEMAIGNAAKMDAIETGSRENNPMQRMLENSTLLQARRSRWSSISRFFNKYPNW